jgi:hypothetical protein
LSTSWRRSFGVLAIGEQVFDRIVVINEHVAADALAIASAGRLRSLDLRLPSRRTI